MPTAQPPSKTPQPAREGGLRVSRRDGERAAHGQRVWLLLAIAAIAAGPLWLLLERLPSAPSTSVDAVGTPTRPPSLDADGDRAPPTQAVAARVRSTTVQAQTPAPLTPADDTHLPSLDPNDLAAYIRPGDPEPTGAEVIRALHEAGIREGLGAFNPPGTVPLMPGIVVPDDFVLPPGYVRHYQVTDAGEMLPPVLMFSPDHDWRDANGQPLPDDRLVPPEMAPPGMPIEPLPLPEPPQG